jgi:hypothetical protein
MALSRQDDGNDLTRKVRPNRVYRFLLSYGIVGHILIMECIVAVEWLHVYTPLIPGVIDYIMNDVLKIQNESSRGSGEPLVARNSGFLNVDGSVVRGGRKRKAQTRKDDQKALNQLRKLGDVNQARYHFLSQSFMQRHRLGHYAQPRTENDSLLDFEAKDDGRMDSHTGSSSVAEDNDPESDAEWIVEALTQDGKQNGFGTGPDATIGLSFGDEGPKINVGIGFSFGEPRKRTTGSSSASDSISDVARQRTATTNRKRKSAGPRVSDRDSGVMGRLRAAGANSLMGRSILGAYPGDLPPPQDAADASGMIALAERYGYGDWSEDGDLVNEQDSEDEHFGDYSVAAESTDGDKPVATHSRRRKTKAAVSKIRRLKRKSGPSPSIASKSKSSPLDSESTTTTSRVAAKPASWTDRPRPSLAMQKIQELKATKQTSQSPVAAMTVKRPGTSTESTRKASAATMEGDSTPSGKAPPPASGKFHKRKSKKMAPESTSTTGSANSSASQSNGEASAALDEISETEEKTVRSSRGSSRSVVNESSASKTTTAAEMLKDYQEKRKKARSAMSLLRDRKADDDTFKHTKEGGE